MKLPKLSLAVAVLMVPSLGVAPFSGGPSQAVIGGEGEVQASSDFLDDASLLAEAKGLPVDEVTSECAGQEDFLAAVTLAYENYPELYYSSGWAPERLESQGYGAWASFSGPVDAEVREAFESLSTPVEVRYDSPVSEAEMGEIRDEVLNSVLEMGEVSSATANIKEDSTLEIKAEVGAQAEILRWEFILVKAGAPRLYRTSWIRNPFLMFV
ncbi:hypothetical protein [Nesterenkonia populi]